MRAILITIGEELLIGQVVDTNSAWMATELNTIGVSVDRILTIPDESQAIQQAIDRALSRADFVLTTGGLGPTKDDITKKAIAEYFGVEMQFQPELYARIIKLFKRWGKEPTAAHKAQCFLPENAELLWNGMGTAPGMWFEREGKVLVSMPGVPREMHYIMQKHVLPRIANNPAMPSVLHKTIRTVGEGETRLATRFSDIVDKMPAHLKVAYLPGLGQVRIRISGSSQDRDVLQAEIEDWTAKIAATIKPFIYGYDDLALEQHIGQLLTERGKTLVVAESCTGGHIAHTITRIPGSSTYFLGGIIAYSNAIKKEILGVEEQTLEAFGAVSEQTVREMADGARQGLGADYALAVSGIAGPDGGTPDKPVGTIWLACTSVQETKTLKLQLTKNRITNIQYSTVAALNLLRRMLSRQ